MAFAISALECKISDGVEYVKIRENFQPDGCPDGLQCLNNICSTRNSVTSDGKAGDSCAVRYYPAQGGLPEKIVITVKKVQQECATGLKCLGDFAEDLYEICFDDNKKCTSDSLRGFCQNPDTFVMGIGWWISFFTVGFLVVVTVVIVIVKYMGQRDPYGS